MPTFENEKQELAFYRCLFFELSSSLIQSDVHLIGNLEQYANGNIPHNASPNQIFDVKFDRRVSDYQLDPTIATRVIEIYTKVKESIAQVERELPLSPRENEVLGLLSTGLLYKEVSAQLGITTGTVKQHAHKIYDKLQVNNRTEAINLYLGINPLIV